VLRIRHLGVSSKWSVVRKQVGVRNGEHAEEGGASRTAGERGDPKTLAELARLAEDAGWDGKFLEDYVFYHNDTYRSLPGAPTYYPWIRQGGDVPARARAAAPDSDLWVGGLWPRKGPLRSAARWDGFIPYKQVEDGRQVDLTPEEVYQIRATTERERTEAAPFDLVVGGDERRKDWEEERAVIFSLAEAGVTWWLEWVPAAGFGGDAPGS